MVGTAGVRAHHCFYPHESRRDTDIKITEIKTFPLKAARDIFVVKVETDEGIYGLGEGGCSSRELAEAEAVNGYAPFLQARRQSYKLVR